VGWGGPNPVSPETQIREGARCRRCTSKSQESEPDKSPQGKSPSTQYGEYLEIGRENPRKIKRQSESQGGFLIEGKAKILAETSVARNCGPPYWRKGSLSLALPSLQVWESIDKSVLMGQRRNGSPYTQWGKKHGKKRGGINEGGDVNW